MAGVADLLKASGLLDNLKRRIDTSSNQQYVGDGESTYSAASSLAGNTLGSLPPRSVLGYAGLHNQGATCYLNSLLQALYCLPELRRAFFEWEYNEQQHGDSTLSVTRQLQSLFAELQLTARSATYTGKLTTSFGWEGNEAFTQHDVSEALMILVDAIHRETIGSPLQSLVDQYLLGTMEHYIICENCKTCNYRNEAYMSLLLPVKGLQPSSPAPTTSASSTVSTAALANDAPMDGAPNVPPKPPMPDIGDALRGYLVDEELSGSNAYACETCQSKQTAHKGIRLSSKKLPSVLCLQLNRFEFDLLTLGRRKVYDPLLPLLTLDMDKYTYDSTPTTENNAGSSSSGRNVYDLHAILMHLGGALGGHYFAYIRSPEDSSVWLEFNDSVVTKIPEDQLLRALGQLGPDTVNEKGTPKENSATVPSSSSSSGAAASVTTAVSSSSTETINPSTGTDNNSSSPSSSSSSLSSTTNAKPSTAVVKMHHSAAGGAYMLIYRRREPLSSCPSSNETTAKVTVPIDTIPTDLRKKIETDNQAYHAARAEWEENRRKITFRLYYTPNGITQRALQSCGLLTSTDKDITSSSTTVASSASTSSYNPFAMPVTNDTNLPYVSVTVKDYESIDTLFGTSLVALGTHLKGSTFNANTLQFDPTTIHQYLRFRHYDHVKKIVISPLTYTTTDATTVMGAGIHTGRSLLLDTRDSAEIPWSPWVPGTLPLRVIVMSSEAASSPSSSSFSSLHATGSFELQLLPTEQTVEHLRSAVARTYNSLSVNASSIPVTPEQIRLIVLRQNMETPALLLTRNDQSLVPMGNKEIDATGPKLTAGDIIHIEICPKEPSDTFTERITNPSYSPVITAWDRQLNLVKVTFNIPANFTPTSPLPKDITEEGSTKLVLTVDQRVPLVTFRSLIAQALNTAPDTFRIRRDMRGPEFKDGKQTLQYYALVDGTSVFLQPGRPLEVDEHEFIITLALPVNEMTAEMLEKLNNSSATLVPSTILPRPGPPVMPTGPRPSLPAPPIGLPGPVPRPGLPTPPRPGLPPPPLPTMGGGPRPPGLPTAASSSSTEGNPSSPNSATTPIGMPQTKYVTLGVVIMKAGLLTKDAKLSIVEQLKDKAKELSITLPPSTHIRIRERLTPNGVKLGKVYIDSYSLSANASSGAVPIKLGDNARELVLQFTAVPEIATEDSIPVIPVKWSPRNTTKPFEWGTEMLASTKETVSELTLRVSHIMGIDKCINGGTDTLSPPPSSPSSSIVTPSVLLCKPHMFALTQATRDPKEIWGFKWTVRLPVRKDEKDNLYAVVGVDTEAQILPVTPVSDTGHSTPTSATSTTVSSSTTEISPSSASSSTTPTATTTTNTVSSILTSIVSQPPLALRPGDILLIVNGEEYDDPDVPGRPSVKNGSTNTSRVPSSARYGSGEVAFKIYTQEEKLQRLNSKKQAEEERKKLAGGSFDTTNNSTTELDNKSGSSSSSSMLPISDIKNELGNFFANKRSRPSDE